MCGATNVTLFGSEVRTDFDEDVCEITTAEVNQAERFTLTGIGPYYPIQIAEPLELPYRSPAKGPRTFEVFAAFLTRIGIEIPNNAVIIHCGRVVDKEDIVEADPGTDVANLLLYQHEESAGIPPYLENRPSALHTLIDAPYSTVFTLRKEYVHRTKHRPDPVFQGVVLCWPCKVVVEQ